MSHCTTFVRSLIKVAVLLGPIAVAGPATPALADSGPSQVLYIFPGATDNGGADRTGVATVVHCFSFSPTQESMQFVFRDWDGTIKGNLTLNINQFQTLSLATHLTTVYAAFSASTALLNQGTLGITATSTNIVCTAQVIDASATVPNGIDLHGTRFNPIAGSQE